MIRKALLAAIAVGLAAAPGAGAATGSTPLERAPQLLRLAPPSGPAQLLGGGCTGPTRAWHDGSAVNTSTFNAFPDPGQVVLHTIHWAGYFGACDASWPRVGDIFYVRIVAGVVNPLQGDAPDMALYVLNELDVDAELPISAQNPVVCFYTPPGGAAQQDTANCRQSPGPSLSGVGASFGGRVLLPGAMFEVRVPMLVKRPRSGFASGNAAEFGTAAQTALGGPGVATQHLFVADRPSEVGNEASLNVADATARVEADAYSYWKAGSVFFDLGAAAGTYTQSSPEIALDGTAVGGRAFHEWAGLTAGTTYHWRARLVVGGVAVTGADQTFTTTGTAPGGGGGTTPDVTAPSATVALPVCRASLSRARCRALRASRPAWRTLRGTVADRAPSSGIAKVEVAARLVAGARCYRLGARGWARVACSAAPKWVRATAATGRWSLRSATAIPRAGRLTVRVRATDRSGHVSRVASRSATLR